ncbi:thioesterase family protein [Salibacterium aidingense]|uniref:thioesterase family protein n=1 Tax=Salibacterium aidingense TaxID=384933 RepID=UPI003BDA4B8F
MMGNKPLLNEKVRSEWVDYNGHMNDAAYAAVFSLAVDELMQVIGLDKKGREAHAYTIYTLETHLSYLMEAKEGEDIRVTYQLLDHDAKRMHVYFVMTGSTEEELAVSEQMLMGINTETGRPDAFPADIRSNVEEIAAHHQEAETPARAGRKIGIYKK